MAFERNDLIFGTIVGHGSRSQDESIFLATDARLLQSYVFLFICRVLCANIVDATSSKGVFVIRNNYQRFVISFDTCFLCDRASFRKKKHKLETHKRNGVGRFIDVCSIRAGRVRTLIAEKIASQALQNNTSRLHQHYDGE